MMRYKRQHHNGSKAYSVLAWVDVTSVDKLKAIQVNKNASSNEEKKEEVSRGGVKFSWPSAPKCEQQNESHEVSHEHVTKD